MSARADRIKARVPLLDVLSGYGYEVKTYNREQQFRCDLHGGSDNAPSARVYPETETWFCFACGKSRDVISTVMEKEGLEFSQACRAIELKYGMEVWQYEEKQDAFDRASQRAKPSLDESQLLERQVKRLLLEKTKARALSLEETLKYWEACNMLSGAEGKSSQWERVFLAIRRD